MPAQHSHVLTSGCWTDHSLQRELNFSLRKGCEKGFANLDVFVHGAHWMDAEVAGQLNLGLWGLWLFFTLEQLKQDPRDQNLRPRLRHGMLKHPRGHM